ncbi:Pentatricopeptide repeat-containing protein 2, mitochondrial [Bulinus truncatus]|nr:Pentatricopeptide repeat-containing protein 2, mitochondrial [Bulinus truncatus]
MAMYVGKVVLRKIFKSLKCSTKYDCISHSRLLFSDADLKLDRYLRQRIFKVDELGDSGKDSILKKLESVSSPSEAKCSLYEFIDLIYIAESKDLPILKAVMQLISKSDVNNIENFNFGASLLRFCYYLGLPTEAYDMYKDPVLNNFLNDNTSHKILMDMLYKQKDYHKVLDVFKGLKRFNIDCITLALAAYYHLDTEESFNSAYELVYKLHDQSHLSRRGLLFFSMLCINQNKPAEALKALEISKGNNLTLNVQLKMY